MKSIYNRTDNQEMVSRINKLTPDTKANWGKMTVSQMLAHCGKPIEAGFGSLKLKRGLMGILFGKMAKKSMLSDKPFKQGLPTDKHFIIKDNLNFDEEKNKLVGLISKIAETGPDGISKEPHPFFGPLTTEEWDALTWKHLDHHLRQFGA